MRGMTHVGKTSSTSRGPLSVGDGVKGISSVITSLVLGMEAKEIVPYVNDTKGSL